jgi:glycosyltransferase involved in cell wall biosynthesis
MNQMETEIAPEPTRREGIAPRECVLLSALHKSHANRSGYPLLAEYLEGITLLQVERKDPVSFLPRMAARVARRVAFSRWYLGGSAQLEWQCLRYLRSRSPSLVHFLWADLDLGFLDFFIKRHGHRLCGTFHHCSDTISSVIRFPGRLRRFAALILMSETQRPFMLQAGVDPGCIHVIRHGVDTEYFTPLVNKPERFQVLTVGGYRRDFDRLHSVCTALLDHSAISVRIVGPAALAPKFAGLRNVEYCHGLNDQQLLAAYREASCFLMLVENATANNAVLEAMACGMPVIADRLGGLPEYVPESAGFLVNASDVAAAVSAVRRMHESPSLRADMGLAARERAEELAWPRIARQTAELYQYLAD